MFGIEDFSKKIVDFTNFAPSQLVDALVFGLAIVLIGMLTVFTVLIILWLFLICFKLVFHDLPAKRRLKESSRTAAVHETEAVEEDKSEEIVAVIAAAIAMAESESSDMKFRVVSFRRI